MPYYNHTEIIAAIDNLQTAYAPLCTKVVLPNISIGGNQVYGLHIGANIGQSTVLMTGAVHAREWGGSEICLEFAADILEAYSLNTGLSYGGRHFTNSELKSIVEGLNWFIIPNANPDGRKFSQETDILWRKNRNDTVSSGTFGCVGVDLNRNHDFLWDFENKFSPTATVNTSSDPCAVSQTYRGQGPHSEPETQNIKWALDNYPIRVYLDIHCSGELMLYSWGNDENQDSQQTMNFLNSLHDNDRGVSGDTLYKEYVPSLDLPQIISLANAFNNSLNAVRGKSYRVGQAFGLYATSGAGDDYAYARHFNDPGKEKVFAYTVEFGTEFQPPWSEMQEIIKDVSSGILAFGLEALCQTLSVELATPSISFNDIPEGETTVRAAVFKIRSCLPVTFQVTDGPNTAVGPANSFSLPVGTSASLPATTNVAQRQLNLWLSYTGTNDGDVAAGDVTIQCVETGEEWTIPINANTIARPTVAISLILDKSNSMNYSSGISIPGLDTRIEVLRYSAMPLIDLIQEDNAISVCAFDQDPHPEMGITPVGPPVFGAGRAAARNAVTNHTPNPAGNTAIGDGVECGLNYLNSPPASAYEVKAMIVLTDGHETAGKYISEVSDQLNDEHVFAIGLGTADVIQPNALNALSNNTGGYLLMTGNMGNDDIFRLSKYYLQILAGVTNTDIVLDPEGTLFPGYAHKIPFHLNETDISSDIILLCPVPAYVHFLLQTPNGDIIDPGIASSTPGVEFVPGSNNAYYRINLPVPIGATGARAGKWHAILKVSKKGEGLFKYGDDNNYHTHLPVAGSSISVQGIPYSLNVHAYSNLRMKSNLYQDSNEPGATFTIRATFSEYGMPMQGVQQVTAEQEKPDGSKSTIVLNKIATGEFEKQQPANIPGVYKYRILANGNTLRGRPFTREQIVTGSVWKGGDRPFPGPEDRPGGGGSNGQDPILFWCKVLSCFFGNKTMSEEFKKKMKEMGFNTEEFQRCLGVICKHYNPKKTSIEKLGSVTLDSIE